MVLRVALLTVRYLEELPGRPTARALWRPITTIQKFCVLIEGGSNAALRFVGAMHRQGR